MKSDCIKVGELYTYEMYDGSLTDIIVVVIDCDYSGVDFKGERATVLVLDCADNNDYEDKPGEVHYPILDILKPI